MWMVVAVADGIVGIVAAAVGIVVGKSAVAVAFAVAVVVVEGALAEGSPLRTVLGRHSEVEAEGNTYL